MTVAVAFRKACKPKFSNPSLVTESRGDLAWECQSQERLLRTIQAKFRLKVKRAKEQLLPSKFLYLDPKAKHDLWPILVKPKHGDGVAGRYSSNGLSKYACKFESLKYRRAQASIEQTSNLLHVEANEWRRNAAEDGV